MPVLGTVDKEVHPQPGIHFRVAVNAVQYLLHLV